MKENTDMHYHIIGLLVIAVFSKYATAGTEAEIIAALDEAAQEGTWGYVPLSGPYIDRKISNNITVQAGKTAVLNCRILYIVGKTVTWIRSRDLHLLTVGRFTYTSDERYKAVHQSGSDDWLLKIFYVQQRDSGFYECQVSTTPPISHSVYLNVVVPKTIISGGPDIYINSGSAIQLTCEVYLSPEPPPYIFWYQDEKLLSYEKDQSGMSVMTEHKNNRSISQLTIDKANVRHSGKYICTPATAPSYSINVHVINRRDEEPAAIHHKNTTSSSSSKPSATKGSNALPEGSQPSNAIPSGNSSSSRPRVVNNDSSKTTSCFSFSILYSIILLIHV